MKLSRAALRPLLAAHERGALPLIGTAWGVTARKVSHRCSPLTRAEPCHWSERRGVSLRERRATMHVMPGVSLRARWDATLVLTRRVPVQWVALCIRNFPSQYRNHFRGLSSHNAGSFNATVFISMLSGGRAGVSINSPAAANRSLLASIVSRADNNSARERCTCSGVWRSMTISIINYCFT